MGGAYSEGSDLYRFLDEPLDPTGPVSETFALDQASNVSNRSGTAETYDQANRLTADGSTALTWSNADRLTNRGADTFGYDPLDRLTLSNVSGTARTYTYNGDGLVQTRAGGVGASFLWDPSGAPSRELKQGNDNIVYGLGPLYVVKADATTLTFARDGSKNVRAEVSSTGAVNAAFRYRSYGQLAQLTASSPAYLGFAGQLVDPSGLVYMRARWYDPNIGRFVTRDALVGDPTEPMSLNSYGYGHANPWLLSDPTGYWPCDVCLQAVRPLWDLTQRRAHEWAFGEDSFERPSVIQNDVTIVNNVRGIVGAIVAVGGDTNTITFGSGLVVSRTVVVPDSDLEKHEVLGHAAQAEERDLGYLPSYLAEQWWNSFVFGKEMSDPFLHFIHSMEIDADRRAGLTHLQ